VNRTAILLAALLAVISFSLAAFAQTEKSILDAVRDRGYVKCAIGNRQVADTRIGENGYVGFFPEFCHVVALAVFGDRNAVEMSPTLIRYGLESISDGDVDIYISNVTWTYSRDMMLKLTPAAVLYYDGQGFLSHRGAVRGALSGLKNASVCVSRSTTTIANLQDYIALNQLSWDVQPFESSQGRNDAFFSRRCDLMTTDRLALATLRSTSAENPDNYVLHEEVISKEPLVAYVRSSDMQWGNVVRWAIFATILAEEMGVTSQNYEEFEDSRDPEIRRLLGTDEVAGNEAAGLKSDWAKNIIAGAGNYGEIFDRYLGEGSPMKIRRGMNRLWKDGGLMYSPPLR
jgi:general L-amino acid transport system substrate-binding protein